MRLHRLALHPSIFPMNILVLSRDSKLYSTRRIVEAGRARGHDISVVDHVKCDLVIARKDPHVVHNGERLRQVDAIIPRIGASVTFYGASVVRQFEAMKVFTTVESQSLVRSRDKLRSLQILSKAGVDMPRTVFTNYSKDVAGAVIEFIERSAPQGSTRDRGKG